MTTAKKVFISYSHDSEAHKAWVLSLAGDLRGDGIESLLDRYVIPEVPFPQWMQNQIEDADFTLLVCTPRYRSRFEGKESASRGVPWEAMIANHILYSSQTRNTRFIAVIPDSGDENDIPVPYRQFKFYRLSSQYRILLAHINGFPEVIAPRVAAPKPVPSVVSAGIDQDAAPIEMKADAAPTPDAFVETEVYSPVNGHVCSFAAISTRGGPEDPVWENQIHPDRPLLHNGARVEQHQSFLAVVEASSREPVSVTARSTLFLKSSLPHGTAVKANQPIGVVHVPRDNVSHPPVAPTRGATFSSILKYSPFIGSAVWSVHRRRLQIIECKTAKSAGIVDIKSPVAGIFHPVAQLQPGNTIAPGDTIGHVDDGSRVTTITARNPGVLANMNVAANQPVFAGKNLCSLRTAPMTLDILMTPLDASRVNWFVLVAPIAGKVQWPARMRPGARISAETAICSVQAKHVNANLHADLLLAEVMELFKGNGEEVSFGERLALIKAERLYLRSPMVGTFYRSKKPGEPPLVCVGTKVRRDDVVFVIEAMKMNNEIEVASDATVLEILVEDGGAVGWNQPVLLLSV